MSIRWTITVGYAMGLLALTAGPAEARGHVHKAPAVLMHQHEAVSLLRAAGLRWVSSGHCARRADRHCTSFSGLRAGTLAGVLQLQDDSHCGVVISGGTEAGHASGQFSHAAGYKLDVLPNHCVNRFIRDHYQRIPTRGDHAKQYQTGTGTTFAREPSHWDITFG